MKRYFDEAGSARVAALFEDADEVWVAPVARVEAYHVIYRMKHALPSRAQDLYYIMKEMEQDMRFFRQSPWDHVLENKVLEVLERAPLKSFDAVQVASGLLAKPDVFITADKQRAAAARKFPLTVVLIPV